MNRQELEKAAEVMRRAAQGEMIESRDKRASGWCGAYHHNNAAWNWSEAEYRILDFPLPPSGQAWHNPAGLNATQVGVHEGWRCFVAEELCTMPADAEYFAEIPQDWISMRECPCHVRAERFREMNFRTKSPLPSIPVADLASFAAFGAAWAEFCKSHRSVLETFTVFSAAWGAAEKHFSGQK